MSQRTPSESERLQAQKKRFAAKQGPCKRSLGFPRNGTPAIGLRFTLPSFREAATPVECVLTPTQAKCLSQMIDELLKYVPGSADLLSCNDDRIKVERVVVRLA